MCSIVRWCGMALAVAMVLTGQSPRAQNQTKSQRGQDQSAATKAVQDKAKADLNEPVAIVNDEPVIKRELIELLGNFEIPPGSEQRAYDSAIDVLVNTKLLQQYMRKKRVPVPTAQVDTELDRLRQQLKQQGSSLESYLAERGITEAELRKKIEPIVQWEALVKQEAGDESLKKYMEENLDVFSGVQVRASHILLKLDPKSTAEAKEEARQKLLGIKHEIEEGKISFPDAANKYSQDDGNKEQPSGGNLGFFPRRGVFIEPFAKAAFAMKVNTISDPVETEYGLHLIRVTERKSGQVPKFEEIKPQLLSYYSNDRQSEIVEAEKKTAMIEIKPMPDDLFKAVDPKTGNAATPAASKGASAPSGKAKSGTEK